MQAFEYADARTKEEAVQLLQGAAGQSTVLAGGTDLLALMKDRLLTPKRLVNIKSIPDLRGVGLDAASGLRIGALTTLAELIEQASLLKDYPSLLQAAEGVRSAQVRNRGTVGGDLLQRPHCWYYRSGFGLLGIHEGKSLIPTGDNRYHAIFGNDGLACFVNASSLAPALIALGAKLRLFGPKGAREVPLETFYRTPANEVDALFELAPDELLTDVLAPPAAGQPNATYEVRAREGLDWPLVTASVAMGLDEQGRPANPRIVLGHVAPVPWPLIQASKLMSGKPLDEALAAQAGDAAALGARPLSRNGYKVRLVRTAVKRAILRSLGTEA